MKSPTNIICRLSIRKYRTKFTYTFLVLCFILVATYKIFSTKPTPLPLGFPPDLSKISHVIQSGVCETNRERTQIEIVFVVLSHADNVGRRNVIRNVYPSSEIGRAGIRRVFVVSRIDQPTPDIKENSKLMEENARFSDLLQLDLTESYDALTYKSLSALKWAAENCQGARFIIKTDDDLLINYYQILDEFQELREENDSYALFGALHSHSEVSRYKKWHFYVSYKEYEGTHFPPYLGGLFYACSPKTAMALVEASKRVPFFKLEDVYVTGFLAQEAGVRLVGLNSKIIFESNKTLNCCRNDSVDVVYSCQYFVSSIDKNKFKNYEAMLLKAREHGIYCHFHKKCLRTNGYLSVLYRKLTNAKLQCF